MASTTYQKSGQSLIELVVSVGLGIIFVTGAIGALTVSLRLASEAGYGQGALSLSRQMAEELRTIVNNSWGNVSSLTADGETEYYTSSTETFYSIETGSRETILNNATYTTRFVLDPVHRDVNGAITEAGLLDLSTLKVTTITSWEQYGQTHDVTFVSYVARVRNRAWIQTNWATGGVGEQVDGSPSTRFSNATNTQYAGTPGQITINDLQANHTTTTGSGVDPLYRYAFNDLVGWIDFGNGTVTFSSGATSTGYGTSTVGDVALDCATTPAGNICGQSLFGVTQDAQGILSGFAWNETLGWVSFNCNSVTPANCAAQGGYDYRVIVSTSTGFLYGWAWSDTSGWISFNCDRTADGTPAPENINLCDASRGGNGQSNYSVRTGVSTVSMAVVTSTILDSGINSGVALNSISWLGTQPAGTGVALQIATSSAQGGPWQFVGPDGTANSYYRPLGPGTPKALDRGLFTNGRYFRYKVILESDPLFTLSPTVTDVIINYSL